MTLLATRPIRRNGVTTITGQPIALEGLERARALAAGDVYESSDRASVAWWTAPGRILAAEPAEQAHVQCASETPGALRIVQGVGYDPGNAAYRFHAALNETTPHASAFFRWKHSNPFCDLRQYDGEADIRILREAVRTADVVHCHCDYLVINNAGVHPRPDARIVRHYHGSLPDGTSLVEQRLDDFRGAVQVGARLSHLRQSPRMQWLPIAVPVQRYRRMRELMHARMAPCAERPFRIAHSPTVRAYKGTDAFLMAVRDVQRQGLAIEAVLIEGLSHADALWLKATCDAVFDSFWLGIQGSGLEGGAMGLPIIAGDPDVQALYREHIGYQPYTYANTEAELVRAIRALASDPAHRAVEAGIVSQYVERYHDYGAVASRYARILREAAV